MTITIDRKGQHTVKYLIFNNNKHTSSEIISYELAIVI